MSASRSFKTLHRLREVFEISHNVTILRDGAVVHDGLSAEMSTESLIKNMVGREVTDSPSAAQSEDWWRGVERKQHNDERAPERCQHPRPQWRRRRVVWPSQALAEPNSEGCLRGPNRCRRHPDQGKSAITGTPPVAVSRMGLGLVPEDRKTEGLFLIQSVTSTSCRPVWPESCVEDYSRWPRERDCRQSDQARLRIKTPSGHTASQNLSGGNQQKCVLARLVSAGCEIMLADEPTRWRRCCRQTRDLRLAHRAGRVAWIGQFSWLPPSCLRGNSRAL